MQKNRLRLKKIQFRDHFLATAWRVRGQATSLDSFRLHGTCSEEVIRLEEIAPARLAVNIEKFFFGNVVLHQGRVRCSDAFPFAGAEWMARLKPSGWRK